LLALAVGCFFILLRYVEVNSLNWLVRRDLVDKQRRELLALRLIVFLLGQIHDLEAHLGSLRATLPHALRQS
jgi:hypothetical protein